MLILTITASMLGVVLCGTPWVAEQTPSVGIHQQLVQQTAAHKQDLRVVFFGDSITYFWISMGYQIFHQNYESRHASNYGIPGDRTEHLIWRAQNGEFDGLNATLVVLMIGTNNLNINTDADIAKGIKEVVHQIQLKLPRAKIILLGVLPRDGQLDQHVKAVNDLISHYDDQKSVFFLDMSAHFESASGVQLPGMFEDKVHLTTKGYQVWHDVMEPLFSKLYTN